MNNAAQDTIELSEPDPCWPELFACEAEALRAALGQSCRYTIHHVGSTAVPGLAAKPIIDIILEVPDRQSWPTLIAPLLQLGYVHWEDNPDTSTMFFVKGMPPFGSGRTHHIHVHTPNATQPVLRFRDYLIAHPTEAARYEALKRELARKYPQDREAFTTAKTTYIQHVLRKAESPTIPSLPDCPLTPYQAVVVEGLLEEITTHHPGVTGFVLQGSAWNTAAQLPDADVDINWAGQPEASRNDPLLGFRKVFTRDGVLIDLCTWFWCDMGQPENAGLATAVSLARSHILWERDETFTAPRREVRGLLQQREWVAGKLAADFAGYRHSLAQWADPANRNPFGHGWDFARHICNVWGLSVLSALLLRPPSAGRKGLLEIVDCAQRLKVPWFGEMALQAMGADTITPAEAQRWIEQLARLRLQAQDMVAAGVLPPDSDLGTLASYESGMSAMAARGSHRESAWPCWRAFHLLAYLLADTPAWPEADAMTRQLRERLGLHDDEAITARLPAITDAVERLERASSELLDCYFALLPEVSTAWDA